MYYIKPGYLAKVQLIIKAKCTHSFFFKIFFISCFERVILGDKISIIKPHLPGPLASKTCFTRFSFESYRKNNMSRLLNTVFQNLGQDLMADGAFAIVHLTGKEKSDEISFTHAL